MTADVLNRRALNRATLARQLLLRRSDLPVLDAVEHLVGLQAQLDAELARHPQYGPAVRDADVEPVVAFVRARLDERSLTGVEIRSAIAEQFPKLDAAALAYACRNRLPLVQVPPRGVWGVTAQVRSTTAEAWLGRPLDESPSLDDVVLRYLGAFGPALATDVAAWSRLTGFREIVERLRPRLRTFRDERGRELLDLPEAPRPDPGTPAPPRFLPEYDNVLLSHADRSRFVSTETRGTLGAVRGPIHGSVLHDGFGFALWRLDRDDKSGTATLLVNHAGRLTKRTESAISAEGRRLLRFLAANADSRDVRFEAVS